MKIVSKNIVTKTTYIHVLCATTRGQEDAQGEYIKDEYGKVNNVERNSKVVRRREKEQVLYTLDDGSVATKDDLMKRFGKKTARKLINDWRSSQ